MKPSPKLGAEIWVLVTTLETKMLYVLEHGVTAHRVAVLITRTRSGFEPAKMSSMLFWVDFKIVGPDSGADGMADPIG